MGKQKKPTDIIEELYTQRQARLQKFETMKTELDKIRKIKDGFMVSASKELVVGGVVGDMPDPTIPVAEEVAIEGAISGLPDSEVGKMLSPDVRDYMRTQEFPQEEIKSDPGLNELARASLSNLSTDLGIKHDAPIREWIEDAFSPIAEGLIQMKQPFDKARKGQLKAEDIADIPIGLGKATIGAIMQKASALQPIATSLGEGIGGVGGDIVKTLLPFLPYENPFTIFAAAVGSDYANEIAGRIIESTDLSPKNKERFADVTGLITWIGVHGIVTKGQARTKQYVQAKLKERTVGGLFKKQPFKHPPLKKQPKSELREAEETRKATEDALSKAHKEGKITFKEYSEGVKQARNLERDVRKGIVKGKKTEEKKPNEKVEEPLEPQVEPIVFTADPDTASGGEDLLQEKKTKSKIDAKVEKLEQQKEGNEKVSKRKERVLINQRIQDLQQGYRQGGLDAKKNLRSLQGKIVKYAQENLPKQGVSKGQITLLLNALKNTTNINHVRLGFEKINRIYDKVEKRIAINKFKKTLNVDPKKVKGKLRGRVDPETQQTINNVRAYSGIKGKDAQKKVNEILENSIDKQGGELTNDQLTEIYLQETFGDLRNKSLDAIRNAEKEASYIIDNGKLRITEKLERRKKKDTALRDVVNREITGQKGVETPKEYTEEMIRSEQHDLSAGEKIKQKIKGFEPGQTPAGLFDTMQQGFESFLDKLARRDVTTKPNQGFMSKYFGKQIHNAYVAEQVGTTKAKQLVTTKLEEIYGAKKHKLNSILRENAKPEPTGITLEDGKGTKLKASQNELYKRWMEYKQPQYRENLHKQGYTQNVMDQIEVRINPKTLDFAKWQLDEFFPEYYEGVNKVFRERYDVDLPRTENYNPIRIEKGGETGNVWDNKANTLASVYSNHLLSRVKHKHDVKLTDGNTSLMSYIGEMEQFKAYSLPMREMKSVFNDNLIQKHIKLLHGKGSLRVLNRFLDDFARGGIDKANVYRGIDKIRSNFTKGVLGMNLPVALKQQASIPAYLFDLSYKQFAKGSWDFWQAPIKNSRILLESDWIKARYGEGWSLETMEAMKRSVPKKLAGITNITDKLMFPTKMGDRLAILMGGWSVYKTKYDQYRSKGFSHNVAHKKAITDFEITSDRTQQSGVVHSLSDLQRRGSVSRLFMMFMTSRNQYYRQIGSGFRNLRAGRGSRQENLKRIAVGHFLLPMAFQFVADGLSWDDENQARAALLGGVNGMLIAGDIAEWAYRDVMDQNYGDSAVETPVGSTAEDVVAGGKYTVQSLGDYSVKEFIETALTMKPKEIIEFKDGIIESSFSDKPLKARKYLIRGGSKATGVPVESVDKILNGVIEMMADPSWYSFRKAIGFSDHALKSSKDDEKTDNPVLDEINKLYKKNQEREN